MDSISIFPHDRFCEIHLQKESAVDIVEALTALGFAYSDIVLIVDLSSDEKQYFVAQKPGRETANLSELYQTLSTLEEGWIMQDNLIISAEQSRLRLGQIRPAIDQAKEAIAA